MLWSFPSAMATRTLQLYSVRSSNKIKFDTCTPPPLPPSLAMAGAGVGAEPLVAYNYLSIRQTTEFHRAVSRTVHHTIDGAMQAMDWCSHGGEEKTVN